MVIGGWTEASGSEKGDMKGRKMSGEEGGAGRSRNGGWWLAVGDTVGGRCCGWKMLWVVLVVW